MTKIFVLLGSLLWKCWGNIVIYLLIEAISVAYKSFKINTFMYIDNVYALSTKYQTKSIPRFYKCNKFYHTILLIVQT